MADVNKLVPEIEIKDDFETDSISTIQQLENAIVKICGEGTELARAKEDILDDSGDKGLSANDSLKSLREDLKALAEEVQYELEQNVDSPQNQKTRIDANELNITALQQAINKEVDDRAKADTLLNNALTAESDARINADNTITQNLNTYKDAMATTVETTQLKIGDKILDYTQLQRLLDLMETIEW